MSLVTRDVEVLKGKVLDQRINFDNMADRVIALEDHVEELYLIVNQQGDIVDSLIKVIGRDK
jgi:hypothetical protein